MVLEVPSPQPCIPALCGEITEPEWVWPVPAGLILWPRSHEDTKSPMMLCGNEPVDDALTRLITCHVLSDVFLKFLIGSFRMTIQGQ